MKPFDNKSESAGRPPDGSRKSTANGIRAISVLGAGDIYVSPGYAAAITAALFFASTIGARWLEEITGDSRPFTLLFLIPVAFGASFFGVRGGLLCAIISLVTARVFLFPQASHNYFLVSVSNAVELLALGFGTLTIALVIGRLRTVLEMLGSANDELRDSEVRRQKFTREVLLAVTGGVMELCELDDLQDRITGIPNLHMVLREPIDTTVLRHRILDEVRQRVLMALRVDDLCTATTEAATNAVKHGGGGTASVWFQADKVLVLIEDKGDGISPAQLARATLERGFSTRYSLGMGYFLMLESVDSIALTTSENGTKLLLSVGGTQKATVEQNILAHYSAT